MSDNLLSKLENDMSTFSKGKKNIADYILHNYEKAAYMTAARLSVTTGVSESTIVRFAANLGFSGYPDLQRALRQLIKGKLNSLQRMTVATDKFSDGDILSGVLSSDIDKIKRTLCDIDRKQFEEVLDLLQGARTIYILGLRTSAALAVFMGHYFNIIYDDVRIIDTTSATEVFGLLRRIGKNDAFIGISFPRYSKSAVDSMKFCSERGASTVAITDSVTAPIADYAGHVLTAYSDMTCFVDSLTAPLSLINALVAAAVMRQKEKVVKTLQDLENVWDEYEVYEKPDENDE